MHPRPPVTFAVLDTETSGLSPRRHRLLQLAVVHVGADGRVLDRWSSLVRPGLARVGGRHIHGLTRRSLRGAPSFASLVPELAGRLDGTVLVAHNLAFDWPFLCQALARAGYATPDARRLCTLELSRSLDPDRQHSHRLADLCAARGIPLTRAHDALADAEATAALLPQLLRDAGISDRSGITDPAGLADRTSGTTEHWPPPGPPAPWWRGLTQRWALSGTG